MAITKIVLTGGPCAGKSTAKMWIKRHFEKLGYLVLFIDETATQLLSGGVTPQLLSDYEFQEKILKLQIKKEQIFEEVAQNSNFEKVLIVCDRGIMDNKSYMSAKEFEKMLKNNNLDEVSVRDNYDAVFHLVTAAKGAEKFYTTENNTVRKETPEEAIIADVSLIRVWTGHPHFRVIENSGGFEAKMKKLMLEISSFLGEPEPTEIERKFLIKKPDLQYLEKNTDCEKVEIVQFYLKDSEGDETRIRQRGQNGNYLFYKTTKTNISDIKRTEIEQKLTQKEFVNELIHVDTTKKPIRKTRYCVTYKNQYFEIDIYDTLSNTAILEIELIDENDEINFPNYIEIIEEVTNKKGYKNYSLAS